MPSLKDLKGRITSVKSTRKITSAMKMVAAAKLRRAQESAEAARPYSDRMDRMVSQLAEAQKGMAGAPPLLVGRGGDSRHLLILCSADRGLCGGFNMSIAREGRSRMAALTAAKKSGKIIGVGRKAVGVLRADYRQDIVEVFEDVAKPAVRFETAQKVADRVLQMWDAEEFDVCTLVYNRFQSAISQVVTARQIIPLVRDADSGADAQPATAGGGAIYEYEPDEEGILRQLLPRNIAVQIFSAMLESSASEHGARMTAMDNATRNAGDMIDALTMSYNRQRQAAITKELIEIISGAEAL